MEDDSVPKLVSADWNFPRTALNMHNYLNETKLSCLNHLQRRRGHSNLCIIHDFETVPNSKKLQTTTEIWLLKDFKGQIV